MHVKILGKMENMKDIQGKNLQKTNLKVKKKYFWNVKFASSMKAVVLENLIS